jgi:hypothetical protein
MVVKLIIKNMTEDEMVNRDYNKSHKEVLDSFLLESISFVASLGQNR